MSESLVRKFMMSPKKVGDLVYKVQVGKNGAHKMIRKQSKAGNKVDDKPGKAEPTEAVQRPVSPPPTGMETMLPLDGRHFESDMFILHVGKDGHQITAHETVLSQSPYLRAKCLGGKQARQIALPDDHIKLFRLVLQYLYSRTFNDDVLGTGPELVKGLAMLYNLGCKYWLGSLTALVVNHYKDMDFLERKPELLLEIASVVYSGTPPEDRAFKEFFIATLIRCHQNARHRFPNRKVLEYIQLGGQLAIDIHYADQRWTALMEREAIATHGGRRSSRAAPERMERLRMSGYVESTDSDETSVERTEGDESTVTGDSRGGNGGNGENHQRFGF